MATDERDVHVDNDRLGTLPRRTTVVVKTAPPCLVTNPNLRPGHATPVGPDERE
jgi:hypothetical protein